MHPKTKTSDTQCATQPSCRGPWNKKRDRPDCLQSSSVTRINNFQEGWSEELRAQERPWNTAHRQSRMFSKLRADVFFWWGSRRRKDYGYFWGPWKGGGGRSGTWGTFTQLSRHKKKKKLFWSLLQQNSSSAQQVVNLLCGSCFRSLRELFLPILGCVWCAFH